MKKNIVMVFGTFDILHLGHKNFFNQVKKKVKNGFLTCSIARDVNVRKIKCKLPRNNEQNRKINLEKTGWVDKVVLGAKKNYILHIKNQKPNFIALGHDQLEYTENLLEKLQRVGVKVKIIRMKPYKRHVYRSSLF